MLGIFTTDAYAAAVTGRERGGVYGLELGRARGVFAGDSAV